MMNQQKVTDRRHTQSDLRDASRDLQTIHRRVCETGRRVEIGCEDSGNVCVLISKTELDCLEHAVEILGDSEAVQNLSGEIATLAARIGGIPA